MASGIYGWKLDGVYKYVGQGQNVQKRMCDKHQECNALNDAINVFGYEVFEKEIIIYCDVEELTELEIYYIKELHTHVSEGGYNISWGGDAPMRGRKHSEESIEKMRVSSTGFRHSEETLKKMSIAQTGRHHSDETRKKIGSYHKGKIISFVQREMAKLSNRGRKRKNSTSQYFGVSFCSRDNLWLSRIMINGKRINIGWYKKEIDAAKAYDKYVIENVLSNSLNFPEDYGVK